MQYDRTVRLRVLNTALATLSMGGRSLCRASLVFRIRVLGLGFCVRVRVRVSVTGSGSYLNEFCNFLACVVPSGECGRKTCGRKITL